MQTDGLKPTLAATLSLSLILLTPLLHPFNCLFSRTTWVSRYQKGKVSLDLNEARDDEVLGCSGMSWTICKQSAPRSRQMTTPTPHYSEIGSSPLKGSEGTVGRAESNGSLPPGLWLTSPAGWLPRTRISSGTLRSVIEYGLPFFTLSLNVYSPDALPAAQPTVSQHWRHNALMLYDIRYEMLF